MQNCDLRNTDKVKVAFTQLPNYSNYLILYNVGLIWSKKSGRFIGYKEPDGYYQTTLTDDNGKQICGKLHRFIYEAVYGPIPEGLQVNHINEIKTDNKIDNLNLMTCKQNSNWGTRNERMAQRKSKPVGAFLNGELKFTFPSTAEAGRNGFNLGNVASCCLGKRKSHKGYEWRYLEN